MGALGREVNEIVITGPGSDLYWRVGIPPDDEGAYFETITELTPEARARDIYTAVDDSTLVRVPQEVVERLEQGRYLMTVTEQDGEPRIVLQFSRKERRGVYYPGNLTEPIER